MSHIHAEIDFAVTVLIVHRGKNLFIKHKQLGIWLPVGGHVELNEDPETAALREAKEESGLEVELLGDRPSVVMPNGRFLIAPAFMDIHQISATHRHIGMVYFARSFSDNVRLAADESDAIRWLSKDDLQDAAYGLLPQIRFYAAEALKRCATPPVGSK